MADVGRCKTSPESTVAALRIVVKNKRELNEILMLSATKWGEVFDDRLLT